MEFSIDDSPAARALGPLFKLTEVHLWDDGRSELRESPELTMQKFSRGIDYGKGDFAKSNDLQGVLPEVTPSISKYWCQRYSLFSRFDHGIKMDEEGWFSVTPELISKHHAVRCGTGAILDFFVGVGGNAIQFAQCSSHVIAIDVDPRKIEYARHNAAIYGVAENIDFIMGDSFSLAPRLKVDTVFMSPPWGGPNYSKVNKFDINNMLRPRNGQYLFNVGMEIASQIVMFLPKNVDVNQLAELSLSATPPWSLEVERNYLNDRLIAITAYFCEPSMS